MNELEMCIILKTDYFQLWFPYKIDLRKSTAATNKKYISYQN